MKLLLDMNLSPAWIEVLRAEGWETTHWQEVGAVNALDVEIMKWAKAKGYCVLTHDLDFSAILAATRAAGPSVVQIRAQDLAPETLKPTLISVLHHYAERLIAGALITIDTRSARIRSLPLR